MTIPENSFHWLPSDHVSWSQLPASEHYQLLIQWARRARGTNPNVFDNYTQWLNDLVLHDARDIAKMRTVIFSHIIDPFLQQNKDLLFHLKHLQSSGLVNPVIIPAINNFVAHLTGEVEEESYKNDYNHILKGNMSPTDFELLQRFAGFITGPSGTNTGGHFGHLNILKGCDAAIQWALFMPQLVANQQQGFVMSKIDYLTISPMRFIGLEVTSIESQNQKTQLFRQLDLLDADCTDFPYDLLFMHHYGKGVDQEPWHGFFGRFMKADTPVPQGMIAIDFTSKFTGPSGFPFVAQFAYAQFEGDIEAMHQTEGYDSDAMYDITRNTMLGQGVGIPYPDKYWTAEVYLKGYQQPGTAFIFSAHF